MGTVRKRKIKFSVLFFLTSCRIARMMILLYLSSSSVKWVQHSLPIPFKAVPRFKEQHFEKPYGYSINGKLPPCVLFIFYNLPSTFSRPNLQQDPHGAYCTVSPSTALHEPPPDSWLSEQVSTEGWAGLPSTDICPVILLSTFFP